MTITADRLEAVEGPISSDTPPVGGGGQHEWVRPHWMGQHIGTALICAAIGYAIGHWFGNWLSSDYIYIATAVRMRWPISSHWRSGSWVAGRNRRPELSGGQDDRQTSEIPGDR